MFPILKMKIKTISVVLCLLLMAFFCILFFRTNEVKANQGSQLYFDEDGQLIMTTYDRKATSSTKYTTLGWTIKRYPGAIEGNQSFRAKLEKYKEDETDPANPNYVYCYYRVEASVLYRKIATISSEWAENLYRNGGYVYLDGIMTVKEGNRSLGSMSEDGTFYGEVYTTFDGIANARGWADKEALRSHFNKVIYFPPNPELLERFSSETNLSEPVIEENVEYVSVASEIGENQLTTVNEMNIYSALYDVERAIPSSESVNINSNIQSYYYSAVYAHHYGTIRFPVIANVTYQITGSDGTESITVQETYEIERSFSYWKVHELNLYYLKKVTAKNEALEGEVLLIENANIPEILLEREKMEYIRLPEREVNIDGGTITLDSIYGDTTETATGIVLGDESSSYIRNNFPLVNGVVGQVVVKNDTFSVNGEIWMNGTAMEKQTVTPMTLQGKRLVQLSLDDIVIPNEIENRAYETTAYAVYEKYLDGATTQSNVNCNAVNVHTPVYCIGEVSDDKAFNQEIVPTSEKSLILGRTVTVGVNTTGTHINEKGYGTRDYQTYVNSMQVSFPFPVIYGEQEIAANTWITLKQRNVTFSIPITIEEGDYEIAFRSIAINANGKIAGQKIANYLQKNNTAEHTVAVTIIGRVSDFKITDVIDYPRWKNVFWQADGVTSTNICYYSGVNDLNGKKLRETDTIYLAPILKGSHPYDSTIHAPGLGYTIKFSLQTIGSMESEEDEIQITPTYYYVDIHGENRQEVRLYRKEDLEEVYIPIVLTQNQRDICQKGRQYWKGSYRIPQDIYLVNATINIDEYMEKRGGRIKTSDEVFLKEGYLIVDIDIQTIKNGANHLSYENAINAAKGYCDMWSVEGFQTRRTDSDKTAFSLNEGEVMVFDLQKTIYNDYESVGTH